MTSYFRIAMALGALCAAACSAADTPPGAKPAVAGPATTAPGAVSPPAAPLAGRHYSQAGGGSLTFTFTQAGAANTGSFRTFVTWLDHDERNPAADKLDVTVQTASLATQDSDRDDTLKSADLLDAANFPTAHFSAASFARSASGGWQAVGKLTLRGVTRDLRLPVEIRSTGSGLELSGEVTIRRLDFGVGQGDWKSTETVGNDVKLRYRVPLKAG